MTFNVSTVGNKTLWASIAAFLAAIAAIIEAIATGKPVGTELIMGAIGALIAIFGSLKGKRIEAKLDALNNQPPVANLPVRP
jgi:hypothetical protein